MIKLAKQKTNYPNSSFIQCDAQKLNDLSLDKFDIITCIFLFNYAKTEEELENFTEIKNKLDIQNKKVIGMVASFTKKKDWRSFIESAKIILSKRDDVVFLAVGDGYLLKEMKLFAGEEMKGKIIFLSKYHPVEEIINVSDVEISRDHTDCRATVCVVFRANVIQMQENDLRCIPDVIGLVHKSDHT